MRKGNVFYNDNFAGIIEQTEGVFRFTYAEEYLKSEDAKQISLLLPLQKKPFEEKSMFPFFDGLIPEGWMLNIVEKNWKVDRKDRMGLLLKMCKNCIGSVTIEECLDSEI